MQTIVIHLEEDKVAKIKKYLQNMEVPFEVREEAVEYNQEFVAKIERSKQDAKNGKGIKISIEELDALWK